MKRVKAVPKGTCEFEVKRAALIQRTLDEKIPPELRISQDIIGNENTPIDVSGIPGSCSLLTAEDIDITENYDAVGLAAAIAVRKYTAVAVATAFSKRKSV